MSSGESFPQDGATFEGPPPGEERPGPEAGGIHQLAPLFRNFRVLLERSTRALLAPWILTVLVDFVFVGVSTALLLTLGGARPLEAQSPGLSSALQIIAFVEFLVVYALRIGLYRSVRRVMFEGPRAVRGGMDVFRDMAPRLGPIVGVNFLVALIVGVGFVLCVLPGLVAAFFLAFSPYLVATRDRPIVEAMRESIGIARRHWALLLIALAVGLVVMFAMGIVMGVTSLIAQGVGWMAVPLVTVGTWAVHSVLGFFAWLYWGAVYVTVEAADTGESVAA